MKTKIIRIGNWDAAFRRMVKRGDDALLDPEAPIGNSWDEEEWRW